MRKLALALFLSWLLVACGGIQQAPPTPTATAAPTQATTPTPAQKVYELHPGLEVVLQPIACGGGTTELRLTWDATDFISETVELRGGYIIADGGQLVVKACDSFVAIADVKIDWSTTPPRVRLYPYDQPVLLKKEEISG